MIRRLRLGSISLTFLLPKVRRREQGTPTVEEGQCSLQWLDERSLGLGLRQFYVGLTTGAPLEPL